MPAPTSASSTTAGKPPLGPRHWPTWLAIGLLCVLARLPWALQRAMGRALGFSLRHLLRSRRRAAERNLTLCFPSHDDQYRDELLRASFSDLGIGVFEFLRAWWGSVAPMQAAADIEGVETLTGLREQGRGVILVSGHFLTLELCGRLLCAHAPLAGMYREHDDPAFEWAVKRGRLRYACAMFQQDELRAAIRHLKQAGILWYAPDQDMRGKDTVFAPFFGIPAASITATHQLARLSGAAVVPFFHRREGARYIMRVGQPLADFPSSDSQIDTARVNAEIESMVREAPTQYLWIHRRFKRRPPGEPPLY